VVGQGVALKFTRARPTDGGAISVVDPLRRTIAA